MQCVGKDSVQQVPLAERDFRRKANLVCNLLQNAGPDYRLTCTQVAASREVLPGRQDLLEPLPGRQDLLKSAISAWPVPLQPHTQDAFAVEVDTLRTTLSFSTSHQIIHHPANFRSRSNCPDWKRLSFRTHRRDRCARCGWHQHWSWRGLRWSGRRYNRSYQLFNSR